MAVEREDLRDWHRLFGLLLTDFFTSSPFRVEVERDLCEAVEPAARKLGWARRW